MPDTTKKKINHKYTDEIVCPYCGNEHTDSWEVKDDDGDFECHDCEQAFDYERVVTVEYCTSKKKETPTP
jgi:transposase-like protein